MEQSTDLHRYHLPYSDSDSIQERVVTVAGGHPDRSAGIAQGLPACSLATAASTAGNHNKDSGLSQHLASLSGP